MKPLPAPPVPGNTDAERMDNAVRMMFGVSKQEIQQRAQKWKEKQGKKRKRAKTHQNGNGS
jgi:hypothetical protein